MSARYAALLTELGIIVTRIEEDGHIIQESFAFENPVPEYLSVKDGRLPRSCSGLVRTLESLNSSISTGDEALLGILRKESVDTQMLRGRESEDAMAAKQRLVISAGFAADARDFIAKLREFAMGLSSSRVTEVSGSADQHIIQAVNSLDEVDKVANALSSRVKEWYGLHFPELENVVDSIEGYARIVLAGRRDVLDAGLFEDAGFPDEKIEMLMIALSKSRGGEITDESMAMVQSMAGQMISLYELRRGLESLIDTEMKSVAPNLSAILGTALSARMLARVGSIKKMASLPASTIQVLGAERALFRSMRTGSEPPKHGLLFQHPMVHAAPRWQRGKIARAIAAKAVIAARVDVYNEGGGLNSTLLEKLNIRVEEIGEKFQEPSAPQKTPAWGRGGGGSRNKGQSARRQQGRRQNEKGWRSGGGGGGGNRGEASKTRDRRRPDWAYEKAKPAARGGSNKKGGGKKRKGADKGGAFVDRRKRSGRGSRRQ